MKQKAKEGVGGTVLDATALFYEIDRYAVLIDNVASGEIIQPISRHVEESFRAKLLFKEFPHIVYWCPKNTILKVCRWLRLTRPLTDYRRSKREALKYACLLETSAFIEMTIEYGFCPRDLRVSLFAVYAKFQRANRNHRFL